MSVGKAGVETLGARLSDGDGVEQSAFGGAIEFTMIGFWCSPGRN